MKKVLIGIFAHPDDEAFGPAGTLLQLGQEGYDIHLILLTDGDAGVNLDDVPDLAATRLEEWHNAADILGARSTTALHYPDGKLDTLPEEELLGVVKDTIVTQLASYDGPTEVSVMSFEPTGLTSHRDHIVASHLAARVAHDASAQQLWYYCLDESQAPLKAEYYHPHAREAAFITTRVDVSAQLADKYRMMDCHHSQRQDAAKAKALGDALLSTECFRVVSSTDLGF